MKISRLFCSFLALSLAVAVSSCDDDPNIGGGGSIPVGDGFYITKVGVNPIIAQQLLAEKTEADGFSSQDREGFFANFVYLAAGNYNVVSVIDQELNKTYGGPVVASPTTGSDCELGSYILVEEFAEDGAAIAVANAGLYKVMFDNTTKEIILYKIEKFHVIGGATEFGWSLDTRGELVIQGSATETGATFKATGVTLKKGEYKIRYNCRWQIDRRIDPNQGWLPGNGYGAFTNFGGTAAALAPGGSNLTIAFGNDGKYTLEVKWSPTTGVTYTATNTEPIAPKAVNSYDWGIIGSATPIVDWSADTDITLKAGSTATAATYELASIALTEGGEFKIRANNEWSIVLKPGIDIISTVTGDSNFESTGGGDPNWKVKTGGAGNYKITVSTTNSGEKWSIAFVKL